MLFKNKTARRVFQIVRDPHFWLELCAYTFVARIGESIFRWLRTKNSVSASDMNQGQKRVQLAVQGSFEVSKIVADQCQTRAIREELLETVRVPKQRSGLLGCIKSHA